MKNNYYCRAWYKVKKRKALEQAVSLLKQFDWCDCNELSQDKLNTARKVLNKEELKYYEYITHIIIDLEFIEEKGDQFMTSLKALVMATDVPIIIYAEGLYPGDMLLSEIARQGLANIIGETPKTLKQISRNKMQKDLREALIKSTTDRRIGLREERQRRFDVTYIPVQKGNNNAIPNYNN